MKRSWSGVGFLVAGTLGLAGCAGAARGTSGEDGSDGGGGDDQAAPSGPDLSIACIVPLMGEFCPPVIYVTTTGSDFNTGETPTTSVRSLPVAIGKALRCQGPPCPIVVAGGTYSAQVVLRDGVTIFGGYAQDFASRDPAAHEVIVTSDDPRTVVADGLVQPTLVDGVTIAGASLTTPDGRSSYAVWANATRQVLSFTHVKINAGKGAAGAAGAAGVDLVCNTTPASGGASMDCGASNGAFGTAAGDPVVGGAAGTGGSSNCPSACPLVGSDGISDGTAGSPGGDGSAGAGGASAADATGTFASGMWSGNIGAAGPRGNNGTGGGGGGSGGTKRIRVCFGCGTLFGGRGGDGAPGGCGGGGGGPGGAGGGSFAVLLNDSDISIDSATITGGAGGTGGTGGDGKGGQAGGNNVTDGIQGATQQKCGLINYDSGAGAPGGVGGKGGAGGGGAGGAGGAAITVARVGNSTLTTTATVQLVVGAAGTAGTGGAGAGSPGGAGLMGIAVKDQKF